MKAILKLCEGGGFFEKKNAQDSYQRQIEFSLFAYADYLCYYFLNVYIPFKISHIRGNSSAKASIHPEILPQISSLYS